MSLVLWGRIRMTNKCFFFFFSLSYYYLQKNLSCTTGRNIINEECLPHNWLVLFMGWEETKHIVGVIVILKN